MQEHLIDKKRAKGYSECMGDPLLQVRDYQYGVAAAPTRFTLLRYVLTTDAALWHLQPQWRPQ